MKLKEIIDRFLITQDPISVESFGDGHINDTFRITCSGPDRRDYLLQKVNTYVFPDIDGLMANIQQVTAHIRKKLIGDNVHEIDQHALGLLKTKDDKLYVEDEGGHCWRVFNFIRDHVVYKRVPNNQIAFEGAKMFGEFLVQLSDLNPKNIVETIPNFHDILFRLDNLKKAIVQDLVGRVAQVRDEIDYVNSRYEIMTTIQNLGNRGIIPSRIVHNDTKINNVLFDRQGRGLCVIDLDTVMPGYAHYDFGDGVRTCANTADEDEQDLQKVGYDLNMFEAFSAGYLEPVRKYLNKTEMDTLAYAPLLFPFIMGVRFLTDFIAGDVYYKIKHPEHNLVRAKAQLKLARDGEAKLKQMQQIIRNYSG